MQLNRQRITALQCRVLNFYRGSIILAVVNEHRTVLAFAEERERDLYGPRRQAVQDGQKPSVAAASGKSGNFTNLGRRQNNSFIPDAWDAFHHLNAGVLQNVLRLRTVSEQRRVENSSGSNLVCPGGVCAASQSGRAYNRRGPPGSE